MEIRIVKKKSPALLTAFFTSKMQRIMKLTFLLIILGILQVKATGWGQNISLSVDNAPLEEIFQQIRSQSGYDFIYTTKLIRQARPVTIHVSGIPVSKALELCFVGQPFTYLVDNKTIVLKKKKKVRLVNPLNQRNFQARYRHVPADTLTGIVKDDDGSPLIGVNVQIQGTTKGTATDFEGRFNLVNVDDNATLVFSYVGYTTTEVALAGRKNIEVQLGAGLAELEELIVVGYGSVKKSDLVGSVTSVSQQKLEENTSPNIFQAMQGAAPGINIQRGSGEPGASGGIQIRGVNSISASNSPLLIFDGIPFAGSIRDINPNDIESIEILKDASAAAIYGSRAANGVILITSKSGIDNGTIIESNVSWSFQNEAVEYQLMGPEEFFEFRKEGYRADGLLENIPDSEIPTTILEVNELKGYQANDPVDWMDEMINQNALVQNYQISVRTGNKSLKDYLSVSFNEEEGLQRTTGFSRLTLKNNIELTGLADWLTIGDNLMYSYNDYERREFSLNNQPAYYRLSPFARIYEEDGSFTKHPQANDDLFINPIAEDELTERTNNFNNLFNNFYFIISPQIVKGLSYRMNLGTTLRNTNNASYLKRGTFIGDAVGGQADVRNSKTVDLTWENILNYNRNFKNHSLGLTGLYSVQNNTYTFTRARASGFVSDTYLWHNLAAGETIGAPQSNYNEWGLISIMGRVNYDYKDKYYLTATGRRDGYSGFATNNKYGFFPSFAVAWRISQETFLSRVAWLDDLKIRASYGSLGNQAVGTYRSLARLGLAQHFFGEELTSGLRVTSLPNRDLSWETTNTMNIGLDYIVANGRFSGSLEFYKSNTYDLLLRRAIPKLTGQDNITFNIGKVQNVGFEAGLNTIPVTRGDFTWNLELNFSTNQNEIVDLYGDGQDDVVNRWFIGEPLGIFYDYEADGIYQSGSEEEIANSATPDRQVGDTRIVDQNGDGAITGDDRKILGYTQPNWLGGLSNTITWKNLSLNIFIQTTQGQDRRFNPEGNWGGRVNRPPVDYWTPENPSNSWFRPRTVGDMPFWGSLDIYDASYTRVKDITLSYNLPSSILSNIAVSKLKLYVNLHDYFTFTKFPYADPEIGRAYQVSIPKYLQVGFNITF